MSPSFGTAAVASTGFGDLPPAVGHLIWAAVVLTLGLLAWNAARKFADREPMVAALAPSAMPTAPAPAPEPPAPPAPAKPITPPAPPTPAAKARPLTDPVTALRRAAERDPARVADALRGWIQA